MKKFRLIGLLAVVLALAFTFIACETGSSSSVGSEDGVLKVYGRNGKGEQVITTFTSNKSLEERYTISQILPEDNVGITVAGKEVFRGKVASVNGPVITMKDGAKEITVTYSGGNFSNWSGDVPAELDKYKAASTGSGGGSATPPTPVEIAAVEISFGALLDGWAAPKPSITTDPANAATVGTVTWYLKSVYDAAAGDLTGVATITDPNDFDDATDFVAVVVVNANSGNTFGAITPSGVTLLDPASLAGGERTFKGVSGAITAKEAAPTATPIAAAVVTVNVPVYGDPPDATADIALKTGGLDIPFTSAWTGALTDGKFGGSIEYTLTLTVDSKYTFDDALDDTTVTGISAAAVKEIVVTKNTKKIAITFKALLIPVTALNISGLVSPAAGATAGVAAAALTVTSTPTGVTKAEVGTIAWGGQTGNSNTEYATTDVPTATFTVTPEPTTHIFDSAFAAADVTGITGGTVTTATLQGGGTSLDIVVTFTALP